MSLKVDDVFTVSLARADDSPVVVSKTLPSRR